MKNDNPDVTSDNPPAAETDLPRLAFTVAETAQIIGTSVITVRRLLARGLLKSAPGLRVKVIPRASIEAFLAGGAQ